MLLQEMQLGAAVVGSGDGVAEGRREPVEGCGHEEEVLQRRRASLHHDIGEIRRHVSVRAVEFVGPADDVVRRPK